MRRTLWGEVYCRGNNSGACYAPVARELAFDRHKTKNK
jgi:hypothetical protein